MYSVNFLCDVKNAYNFHETETRGSIGYISSLAFVDRRSSIDLLKRKLSKASAVENSIAETTNIYQEKDNKNLSSFPKELISEIFSHVDLPTFLRSICLVNKQWDKLGNNKALLERLKKKFSSEPKKETQIEPDHEIADPVNPDSTVPIVGVIEEISWKKNPTDPLFLTFLSTQESQGKIQSAYNGNKDGVDINIEFNVYKFDENVKVWFEAFTTGDRQIKCVFTRNVDPVFTQIAVTEVTFPKVYRTQLSLTGLGTEYQQKLILGFHKNSKIEVKFGSKVT